MSSTHETDIGGKIGPDSQFYGLICDAYRAFDDTRPAGVDVCTVCCMSKEIEADFFRQSRDRLPMAYLQEWFSSAYSTEGVQKDIWTYLLPRILEILAANEEPNYLGLELTLSRFRTGNPEHWSNEQWDLLDRFQRKYLRWGFESTNSWAGSYLDDVLCMFVRAGWDLAGILEQAQAMPDEQIANRLWRDWCQDFVDGGHVWITANWKNEERPLVYSFYNSDGLHRRMEQLALNDSTKPEVAKKASDLVTVIEMQSGRRA